MSERKRVKRGVKDEDALRCPPHPRFVGGLCFLCGVKEEDTEGGALAVAVGHETMKEEGNALARCRAHPETVLDLSNRCGVTEEDAGGSASGVMVPNIDRAQAHPGCAAATSTAGASDMATLLRERKLILVLDLDRTLLNSTRLDDLSEGERFLELTPDTGDNDDMDLFRLDKLGMLTKLRPFVRGFLEQASSMFEMYVHTMGNQVYAKAAIDLLDPNGIYFGGRVVSRDESTQEDTKSLDVIPGADPVVAVILDALDNTDLAWPGHQDNLILTEQYRYFASTCRNSPLDISLAEMDFDEEGEQGGSLAVALGVLKRVHRAFFDGSRADVREVITELRGQVLRGCTVTFSYLHQSLEDSPNDTSLWKLAERLGAACRKDADETVTHVVAVDPGTQKAQWARDNDKFLVNPEWITAAIFRWCREDEQEFPMNAPPSEQEFYEVAAVFGLYIVMLRASRRRARRNIPSGGGFPTIEVSQLKNLCEVLGIDLKQTVQEIDNSIADPNEWILMSQPLDELTTNRLSSTVRRLSELKSQRFNQVKEMGSSILLYWKILPTSVNDQQDLISLFHFIDLDSVDEIKERNSLSLAFIDTVENELSKLKQHADHLVSRKMEKLKRLCEVTHLEYDCVTGSNPLMALTDVRKAISHAKGLVSKRQDIVNRIVLLKGATQKIQSLKSGIFEANEEKALEAKNLVIFFPKMMTKLKHMITVWNASAEVRFQFDGEDAEVLLETLVTNYTEATQLEDLYKVPSPLLRFGRTAPRTRRVPVQALPPPAPCSPQPLSPTDSEKSDDSLYKSDPNDSDFDPEDL